MYLGNELSFIGRHISPLYIRISCAQFGWNCPSGSGEDFKFHQCICGTLLVSSLWKVGDPLFEQTWIPFTQGCFKVLNLVEIGPIWFLRRRVCNNNDNNRQMFIKKALILKIHEFYTFLPQIMPTCLLPLQLLHIISNLENIICLVVIE